jgi:heme exporter protein A
LLEARALECVRDERVLFTDLAFSVAAGSVLEVEGHNGSGKTSLLRILCGLAQPAEGEVLWRGKDIERDRPAYFSEMAYQGHTHGVKLELTPLENLRVARALKPSRDEPGPWLALEQVGLRGYEDVPARMLSAGQCRRVALARLLTTDALLWILDEPFTAIDKQGVAQIEEMIMDHTRRGGAVVLTTHHKARLDGCDLVTIHLGATG